MSDNSPPYHIVNVGTGKHCGPFSSYLDAALAVSINTDGGWCHGKILNRDEFEEHLFDAAKDEAVSGVGVSGLGGGIEERIAKVLFTHGVAELSPSGHVYCRCSKFHPFQGLWAHSVHVAAVLAEAIT